MATLVQTEIAAVAQQLSRISLFSSLQPQQLADLVGRMVRRSYSRGQAIVRFHEPGEEFFLIRSGQVKVTVPGSGGGEAVVAVLGEGDFFGEMAVLDGRMRSASVIALETAHVLALGRDAFLDFVTTHPEAAMEIMRVLAQRVRVLNAKLEEAYFHGLEARLAHRLLELGRRWGERTAVGVEIRLHITQTDLAGMVGASRQRVNRALADWEGQGIIRLGRRSEIFLLKPDRLEQIAAL